MHNWMLLLRYHAWCLTWSFEDSFGFCPSPQAKKNSLTWTSKAHALRVLIREEPGPCFEDSHQPGLKQPVP